MLNIVQKMGIRTLVILTLIIGAIGNSSSINLQGNPWFYALLLGAGLVGCTFGIDKNELKGSDWRVVALAVTVGVFVKALIIGIALYFASGQPMFLVLGLVVAQIDPLSVGALVGSSHISKKADNLLRAWSSLDDPVTVLLTVMLVITQQTFKFNLGIQINSVQIDSATGYGLYLFFNLALVAVAVWMWRLVYRGSMFRKIASTAILLVVAILAGATWYWMFGLALMGLCIRPETKAYDWINAKLETAARFSFLAAGTIVGWLLFEHVTSNGLDSQMFWGLALGAMAFISQAIVVPLVTIGSGYSKQDRLYLAIGHQNGLTAASLGLATGTVAIVIPAIIMTHILYGICNAVLNKRFATA
ncbi:MAG: hypothetical protein PVI21_00860 [Candidatus Woesebacteria bacterium]|jgi:hypothetical protein